METIFTLWPWKSSIVLLLLYCFFLHLLLFNFISKSQAWCSVLPYKSKWCTSVDYFIPYIYNVTSLYFQTTKVQCKDLLCQERKEARRRERDEERDGVKMSTEFFLLLQNFQWNVKWKSCTMQNQQSTMPTTLNVYAGHIRLRRFWFFGSR